MNEEKFYSATGAISGYTGISRTMVLKRDRSFIAYYRG